jgi:hypothetical protein
MGGGGEGDMGIVIFDIQAYCRYFTVDTSQCVVKVGYG